MERRCKECGEVKPVDGFYRNSKGRDGLRPECKACTARKRAAWYVDHSAEEKARVKSWQQANSERVNASQRERRRSPEARRAQRDGHLRRKFGITIDAFEEQLAAQGGVCAICRREPHPTISLHVDHDHESGALRGLICFDCNAGLGKFRDDRGLLAAAARYLLEHDPGFQADRALIQARLAALKRPA